MDQKKSIVYLVLTFFIVVLCGVGFYLANDLGIFSMKNPDNGIQSIYAADVPYFGHYNAVDENAFLTSGNAAAVASVIRYYKTDTNLSDINEQVSAVLDVEQSYQSLMAVFGQNGLQTLDGSFDRDSLISALESNSLVFTLITLDEQSAGSVEAQSHYPVVIVGYDRATDIITMHSYWYGPAYQLSFTDFLAHHDSELPNAFYAVSVASAAGPASADITTENPYQRDTALDVVEPMMRNYALAILASEVAGDLSGENEDYLQAIADNDQFESLHPYVRLGTLIHLAGFSYRRDDFAAADQYYEYIFANNKDMDKPFGPWAGFNLIDNSIDHKGELSYMHYGFGNYNKYQGNSEAAIAAYEKALEIRPGYTFVQGVLDAYKVEINQ